MPRRIHQQLCALMVTLRIMRHNTRTNKCPDDVYRRTQSLLCTRWIQYHYALRRTQLIPTTYLDGQNTYYVPRRTKYPLGTPTDTIPTMYLDGHNTVCLGRHNSYQVKNQHKGVNQRSKDATQAYGLHTLKVHKLHKRMHLWWSLCTFIHRHAR